jgi:hypothetical protein
MTESNSQNRKNYSLAELILGNGVIVLWIILGALSCALFYPLSGVLFFGVAAFLVFYELGKHGCVTCYFCKTSQSAWENCLTCSLKKRAQQT